MWVHVKGLEGIFSNISGNVFLIFSGRRFWSVWDRFLVGWGVSGELFFEDFGERLKASKYEPRQCESTVLRVRSQGKPSFSDHFSLHRSRSDFRVNFVGLCYLGASVLEPCWEYFRCHFSRIHFVLVFAGGEIVSEHRSRILGFRGPPTRPPHPTPPHPTSPCPRQPDGHDDGHWPPRCVLSVTR